MGSLLLGSIPKPSLLSYADSGRGRTCKTVKTHFIARSQSQLQNIYTKGSGGINSSYQGQNKQYLVRAASGQPLESKPGAYNPKSIGDSVKSALDAFYRFSRPHTVVGTTLSIISVSLLAVEKVSDLSPLFFTGAMEAVVAALLMNIYIVGLNQLSDIDIDKVNKPYLPLASGEYSLGTGISIVTSVCILSFGVGWAVGSWPLFWALFTSFLLGTAYSINVGLLVFIASWCSICSIHSCT